MLQHYLKKVSVSSVSISLREIVDHQKPSFCFLDVLSPLILKQTFDSIGTCE